MLERAKLKKLGETKLMTLGRTNKKLDGSNKKLEKTKNEN